MAALAIHAAGVVQACELVAGDAMVVVPFPAARSAAAYLKITNACDADDRLLGASADIARHTMLHSQQTGTDGVVTMRPIEDGLDLPSTTRTVLEPGGNHVMLFGLTGPLNSGDLVRLELHFENSGPLVLMASVRLAAP